LKDSHEGNSIHFGDHIFAASNWTRASIGAAILADLDAYSKKKKKKESSVPPRLMQPSLLGYITFNNKIYIRYIVVFNRRVP